MYICICKAVSDKDIRQAVADGVQTFAQLQACTGCSTCCGRCRPDAQRVLRESLAEQRERFPLLAVA